MTTDLLLDILTRFPNCKVTINTGHTRPKPREGDVKVVRGKRYVRHRRKAYEPPGCFIGYEVRNGRPLYDWVREDAS